MANLVDELRRRAPAMRGSIAALRTAHLAGQVALRGDLSAFVRVHFLAAATRLGLLQALPASRGELIRDFDVANEDLLDALLGVGVSLGEIAEDDGRFSVKGQRSLALVSDDGPPIVAMLEEFAGYHSSVYRELPERLAGGPLGDYLPHTATVVANSSRIVEPFVVSFVRSIIGRHKPGRMLEVGCGSGIYLRAAAEADAQLTGVGIDIQPDVVALAQENLRDWGVADRFRVVVADIRHPPDELAGPFDLVTLYNNAYYFPVDERPELFRGLRERMSEDGVLALVSMMQGDSAFAADLDLTLRSTLGATALPQLKQLEAQLHESGFSEVDLVKLVATEPFYGVVAR